MQSRSHSVSGNMLLYILGAVFLLGILIVLLKGSFQEGTGIDLEKVTIKVSEVQRYASELERGVNYVLNGNNSESDIRFAVPDNNATPYGDITDRPARQVFDPSGGGVEYRLPPKGINDGTAWQFYATTHFQDLGTDTPASSKAELVAVLPKVTDAFCNAVNRVNGQTIDLTQTTQSAGCVYDPGQEFVGTFVAGAGNHTLDPTKITKFPAKELCVKCASGQYHYYRVLLTR